MTAMYRFLAYDLRTNTPLEELTLQDVTYGYKLNGAGGFSATMPLAKNHSRLYLSATVPTRTAIYVERDDVLVWGGVLWGRARVKNQRSATLVGEDWFSYLNRRTLKTRKVYSVSTHDQFAIVADLVAWVQAQTGGDISLNVVRSPTNTGRLRDRIYESWDRKNVGEAITELSAVIDGFDFTATSQYGSGIPVRQLELSYPRRGRTAFANELVFETGKNVVNYDWPEDGSRTANAVDAIGAGDGTDMLISTAVRTDLINAGYPLLDDIVTFKDVKVRSTLTGHAQASVNARATPVTSPHITVRADLEPIVGSWIVGDDARIRIEDDELFPQDEQGKTGLDVTRRIVEAVVQPFSSDGEIATLTFAEVPSPA